MMHHSGHCHNRGGHYHHDGHQPIMPKMITVLMTIILSVLAKNNNNDGIVLAQSNNDGIVATTIVSDESIAKSFIKEINERLQLLNVAVVNASWNFNTNINQKNEASLLQETAKFNAEQKKIWKEAKRFDYRSFNDSLLKRQLEKLVVVGVAALDDEESKRFTNISTEMEKIYSSSTVCIKEKCGLDLEPDLTKIVSESQDYEELKEVWVKWRDVAGKPVRSLYREYVQLGNKAAKLNGFKTLDDLWLFPWNTPNFKQQVAQLWDEVKPYYQKIHAYVRKRLRHKYGSLMPKDGTIPAHLLGNIWAQTWNNIFSLVAPFPGKKSLDVTEAMKAQNYTPLDMFRLSEKFFTDLALIPMPESFWQHSMIVRPNERKVVCHASAWDFYNKKDFRIKMCTRVNMEDLITIHHEMGHIQYYLQYKNQPVPFREGANPGFHEAVGDLLSLSVSTPGHLKKIELLTEDVIDDEELTLNYQMQMALQKIVFLPFGYLIDAWRWDVFSGKISFENMNRQWWWYRLNFQGISPPIKRNERDFDPGAKYHIPAGIEYIRYFVSTIIQFQFHKSLCKIAQPNIPLHKCDIDGNLEAGERLAQMLQLGSSVDWPDAMELITGSRTMSAKPMIEYFQPLFVYIDKQLQNETIGWEGVSIGMEACSIGFTKNEGISTKTNDDDGGSFV